MTISNDFRHILNLTIDSCINAWLAAASSVIKKMEDDQKKQYDQEQFIIVLAGNMIWAAAGFLPKVLGVIPTIGGALMGAGAVKPIVSPTISWELVRIAISRTSVAIKEGLAAIDLTNWSASNDAENARDLKKKVWERLIFQNIKGLGYEENADALHGGDITGEGLKGFLTAEITALKADFDLRYKEYVKEISESYLLDMILEQARANWEGPALIDDDHLLDYAARKCHRPFHYKVMIPVEDGFRQQQNGGLQEMELAFIQQRRIRCEEQAWWLHAPPSDTWRQTNDDWIASRLGFTREQLKKMTVEELRKLAQERFLQASSRRSPIPGSPYLPR